MRSRVAGAGAGSGMPIRSHSSAASAESPPEQVSTASPALGLRAPGTANALASSSFLRPAAPSPSTGTPGSVGRFTVASASAQRSRASRLEMSPPWP